MTTTWNPTTADNLRAGDTYINDNVEGSGYRNGLRVTGVERDAGRVTVITRGVGRWTLTSDDRVWVR